MGMSEGNIIATIPTPQIAVKRTKATPSSVPAIGMFALATKYQETRDSTPRDPARAKAVPGIFPVNRDSVRPKLAQQYSMTRNGLSLPSMTPYHKDANCRKLGPT